MSIITIRFTHFSAQQPKYTFGEQIAIKSNCDRKKWITGQVTGLRLDYHSPNTWNYTVVFDYPQGFCEEFTEEDLAAVDELVCPQLLL
ncbi:hypothetical protein [Brunnivagina elsteri]|uniref:Uncharacterized protein n=1 Tax=Brunnivagina elsteri CCALA 953 TaxID=987040 RepID=A0A2A2T9P3_9CYAN|nr:hypothetical protein [Calothrix elsteri]PAX45744.1 hypothetical protein CK510_30120 [Calothrix elsteri CCALA 953]